MARLYRAIDKEDAVIKCWLVNEKGVAVSLWIRGDDMEALASKRSENYFIYRPHSAFEECAINPVLIAEW